MVGRTCKLVSVLGAVGGLMAVAAPVQAADKSNLNITIKQIKNANGQILVCLFDKPKGFPACTGDGSGVRAFGTKAKKGSVSINLKALPVGTYAVSAAHDQNNDGKIDKHFLFGYPTEGAGMSNYPEPLRGKPNFDIARFKLTKVNGAVEIIMHYP